MRKKYDGFDIPGVSANRESQYGIFVQIPGNTGEDFVPFSQITDDSEVFHKGHKGVLVVTQWFAEKRGFDKT